MSGYIANLVFLWCVTAIICLGLTLTLGRSGLFNISHLVSAGVGAYSVSIFSAKLSVPVSASLLIGVTLAAAVAYVFFIPARRCDADSFALLSLCVVVSFVSMLRVATWLTGGVQGAVSIGAVDFGGFSLARSWPAAAVALLSLVLSFAVVRRLVRSRYGRILAALRDDPVACEIHGINGDRFRISSLAIAGGICGLAGGLLAQYLTVAQPNQFGLDQSFAVLSATIFGGVKSPRGALVAATLLVGASEALRFLTTRPDLVGPLQNICFAVLMLVTVAWFPSGVVTEDLSGRR